MKRKIISLLVCVLVLSLVTPTAIAANEISEDIAVNINSMMCSEIDVVNIENYEPMSSTRATARVEVEVNPSSIMRGNTALSLEADELVTINCTYSPRTADVDFGLITPQNTFRYLSGEDGSFRKTIQVNETGKYYFAVRNNTSRTIEILGYVYY